MNIDPIPAQNPGYLNQVLDALDKAQQQNCAYAKKVEDFNNALQELREDRDNLKIANHDLKDRLDDSQKQILILERQLKEQTDAKNSWMRDATRAIQEQAYMERSYREVQAHNTNLQNELRNLSTHWQEAINWVIANGVGRVGCSFAQIIVECLENQINWKGHHDSLKRQADAKISELQDKLSKASTYIEGLERDVAMLHSATSENIQPNDTIFLQVSDTANEEQCGESFNVLQALFPNNKIITLPIGLDLHAIAQING